MAHYLVISDTHMPSRAKTLPRLFADQAGAADAILHAGDFTDDSAVMELESYCPLYGVQGNNDSWSLMSRFPVARIVDLNGFRIGMTHGHIGRARTTPERAREQFSKADVDLIIFGHSHTPYDAVLAGVRCVNPGSLCDPRRQPAPSFVSLWVNRASNLQWDVTVDFCYLTN